MRLNTKSRFAVIALVDVVIHGADGAVALPGISQRLGISLSYLEQIFATLRRCGIVGSVRGPGGGYRLRRPADALSVAEIVLAFDKPWAAVRDTDDAHGSEVGWVTEDLWLALHRTLIDHLRTVSLRDLVDSAHSSRPEGRTGHGIAARIEPGAARRPDKGVPHGCAV